eukprot:149376_1
MECASCKSSSASRRCGGCQLVYYCDTKCQRNHWKVHKKKCNYKKPQKNKKSTTANHPTKSSQANNDEAKKADDNTKKNIEDSLRFIGDETQSYLLRLEEVSLLLQPPDVQKFMKIEQLGLWQTYDKVLEFAYNHLKQLKNDAPITQKSMNTQMMAMNITSAITMRKEGTFDGTDTCTESNCIKLLHHTVFWPRNMEMMVMNTCDIEYKRMFFRILTLILNFKTCGKYILEHLIDFEKNEAHKTQLNNLIHLTDDSIDSPSHNALQGLAVQCFCQLYIHCEQLKIRQDLKDYLETKTNMYFQLMYDVAKKQMNKGSALSFDDMAAMTQTKK